MYGQADRIDNYKMAYEIRENLNELNLRIQQLESDGTP